LELTLIHVSLVELVSFPEEIAGVVVESGVVVEEDVGVVVEEDVGVVVEEDVGVVVEEDVGVVVEEDVGVVVESLDPEPVPVYSFPL
jgi:hypothetical protein